MLESKVTTKGQTTLPRDVRAALDLASGDRVRYFILDKEVRIIKVRSIRELKGILARPGQKAGSLDAMEAAIAERAAEEAAAGDRS